MARREAMLSLSENPTSPRFINQTLSKYFSDRTVESIKGQRRNMVYCDVVQLAIEELRTRNDVSSSEERALHLRTTTCLLHVTLPCLRFRR